MFLPREELQCGVFDSSVLRGNKVKSAGRRVVNFELELFHREGGVSHVGDGTYPARRGMLLCAKPGQTRYSDFPVRCSYIRIQPRKDSEIDALLAAAPDCLYIKDEGIVEELMALFTKLCSVLIGAAPERAVPNGIRSNGILLDILYRLQRLWQGSGDVAAKTPIHRIAADAYEYFNEHYAEDCSLKTVAAALHVSPNYLHSVFLREVGVTPFAYVTDKRVRRAKRLIAAGEKSMLEIAMETGFCSQSHFNKVFREATGQTPAAYRRRLLEQY
ncbi:MAG: helix-turn-helix transcriptional regulator [Ruminococcaceae bacterium]|nr:helix-turn-helix transcriptional regulator [Oscillospiraceae bacterium]